jgi:hypothetical protein
MESKLCGVTSINDHKQSSPESLALKIDSPNHFAESQKESMDYNMP